MKLSFARSMTRAYFAVSLVFFTIAYVTLRMPVKGLTFEVYESLNVWGKAAVYGLAGLTLIAQFGFYFGIFYLIYKAHKDKPIKVKTSIRLSVVSLFLMMYSLFMSQITDWLSLP